MTPPDTNPLGSLEIGAIVDARFHLDELLAVGGMGEVYRARQLPLGRQVALKILRADAVKSDSTRKRFVQEADLLTRLYHPNTVSILATGQAADGRPWIAMEYVDGEPLSYVLERRGSLPVAVAVKLAAQLASALAEAHDEGIVHRDVKADNILIIDPDGAEPFAKILDFGIATTNTGARLTAPGRICGTTDYMSPEQTRGEALDGRSDVYSLGVVLFEMLEGRLPYVAPSAVEQAVMHQLAPLPPFASSTPKSLQRCVHAAMAKRPEERPQSATRFREMLTEAQRAPAERESFGDWARAALIATIVLLLAVGVWGALG